MLGDHGALIAVQGDAGVVEGLLGVLEDVVEFSDPSLKHRAEVTGDQRPADGCRETEGMREPLKRAGHMYNDQKGGRARCHN